MPKRIFVLVTLGALLLIVKGFALAWVEPTLPPPTGNVSAPLNTGANYQIKSGILQIKNPDASSADTAEGNWFHIGTYNKTFVQAQAACQAQGARLAYYSEIVDAFKNGANVCSWGWVSEGFVVYPMQDGAAVGCGGAVGGVRVIHPALTATYGAYCARDSFLINGSLANGGNLYAKGLYLNSGQSAGQMYFGLLDNGSNADKLGICFNGDCKTAWDQVAGSPTNATYLTISSDATLTNERIITAGTGITITDGGAGGNLTINVNPVSVQTRVAVAGCAVGSSIRVIAQDGAVTCEVDDTGSGSLWTDQGTYIFPNNYNQLVVTDTGNIGIGDTSPDLSLKLDVEGQVGATGYCDQNGANCKTILELATGGGSGTVGPGTTNKVAKFTAASTVGDSIITDNGTNVGIGDSTPSAKLEVAAPASGDTVLLGRVAGQSSIKSSDAYLLLDSNGSSLGLNWYSADDVILARGGGDVGVGTTAPLTKLHVADTQTLSVFTGNNNQGIRIANCCVANSYAMLGFTGYNSSYTGNLAQIGAYFSSIGSYLQFGTSNNYNSGITNTAMTIDYLGRVGIGIATPTTKLEVAGQVKITGGTPGAGKVLTSDATGLATWQTPASGGVGGSGSPGYIPKFAAATTLGNSQIRDDGTNIAIGKATSPAYKVDVAGSLNAEELCITGICQSSWPSGGSGLPSGVANQTLRYGTSWTASNLLYNNDSGVGIGTAPISGTRLAVVNETGNSYTTLRTNNNGSVAGLYLDRQDTTGYAFVDYTENSSSRWLTGLWTGSSNYIIRDRVNNLDRVTILPNGNVGIGIAVPSAKLEVAGTAKMTGFQLGASATAGYVLTTDASGVGTWQAPTSGGGIGGSGALNYIPKFTPDGTTLGNSIISDNSTILTVQSPGPALRLQDNNSDGSAAISYIEFYDMNSRQGYLGFGSSVNSDMFFANQENGNWIFSGSGGMGIGTTTPYGAKLNVADGPIKASGGLILENRTTNVSSPESGAIWICVDVGYDCQ